MRDKASGGGRRAGERPGNFGAGRSRPPARRRRYTEPTFARLTRFFLVIAPLGNVLVMKQIGFALFGLALEM